MAFWLNDWEGAAGGGRVVELREAERSSTVGSPPPPESSLSPLGPDPLLPEPAEGALPRRLPVPDLKLPLRLLFLFEPRLEPDPERRE